MQQAVVYFTIDTQAPTLSILKPIEGYFLNVSWVNLTWSGDDAISAIGSYQVRIDGGEWSEMQQSSFRNITGLSDGTHTAEVKAIDLAGNEIVVSVSFIVDTIAPTVTITAPSEGHYSSSSSVSVTWSGDDIGVGVQAYQYRVERRGLVVDDDGDRSHVRSSGRGQYGRGPGLRLGEQYRHRQRRIHRRHDRSGGGDHRTGQRALHQLVHRPRQLDRMRRHDRHTGIPISGERRSMVLHVLRDERHA